MICINCVTPKELKALIHNHGAIHSCQYCGGDAVSIIPEFLFDYILERVNENTANEDNLSSLEYWMTFEGGSDEISVNDFDIVLAEWMNLGDEVYFDDLSAHAPEEFKLNDRGMDRHYFADDGLLEWNVFEEKWTEFITNIRHSHRFFNPSAKEFLDLIFASLAGEDNELKLECVRIVQKGESLYRARSASTLVEAEKIADSPASELGRVPCSKASSQRMTPNGISALYCSLERETCLSEIRSITGDYVVSIAMTPFNQLKLLDLTKLGLIELPKLTLLEEGYRDALHLKTFISSLVRKMSKPKGRNDELNYLSTQVVFEYLRLRFCSQVDGLVFPSVQTGEHGTNVILFPEASIVSSKNYIDSNNIKYEKTAEPDFAPAEKSFFGEPTEKLYCLSGSLRFHKVKSIETKADEFSNVYDLQRSEAEQLHSRWF